MDLLSLKNSTTTSSSAYQDKVNKSVLKNFEPNLVFDQFGMAPIEEDGVGGSIVWGKFPKLGITVAESELIDGITSNDVWFNLETISVASKQYGLYAILSDKLTAKTIFNLTDVVGTLLWDNMARIIDNVIQNEVTDNATNRVYAATTAWGVRAANRWSLSASHKMFTYDIACMHTKLSVNSSPKFSAGAYVGVLHPYVAHWIKTESGAGGWLNIKQYTSAWAEDVYKWEIGMIHGVRIIESANVKSYASAITVYPATFFGKWAYWVASLQGLSTIVKWFWSAGTADPLNQRMTIGVKKSFAPKILNQDSIVVFESAWVVI